MPMLQKFQKSFCQLLGVEVVMALMLILGNETRMATIGLLVLPEKQRHPTYSSLVIAERYHRQMLCIEI